MEDNKELVSEETENVEEQTTEEIVNDSTESDDVDESTSNEETVEEPVKEEVRTYTDEEVNEIASKRAARIEKKLRREYDKKYSKLESILNAGLETNNVEDATSKLEDFYKSKGIEIPNYELRYTDDDINALADHDANEIISLGYDEIREEGERLANLGKDMTHREKLVLEKLTSKMKELEEEKELSSIGVTKEQLDDDFRKFEKKLNPNLSLKEKYEMYTSTKPKKQVKPIGSMKSGAVSNELKDFYTYEEASKLTDDDYKKNPKLYEIVESSMLKWK